MKIGDTVYAELLGEIAEFKVVYIKNNYICVDPVITCGLYVKHDDELFRTKEDALEDALSKTREIIAECTTEVDDLEKYCERLTKGVIKK
jgi:hypothetical protein